MNAIELLEQQHDEAEELMNRLEKGRGDRTEMLRELAAKLAAHMRIEEEIFYPRCREVVEKEILESLEEHTLAAFGLKRLCEIGTDDPSFAAKLKAVKELVLHHVEEEEDEWFPKVQKAFDRDELETLGAQMEERFQELVESGYGAELVKDRRNGSARKSSRPMSREMR